MDRKQETKIVKAALAQAGIHAVVTHGRGTAYGWLEINVGSSDQFGPHNVDAWASHVNCEPCRKIRAIADEARRIAQAVTGRQGEYRGEISVLSQKHWDARLKLSVEIVQPAAFAAQVAQVGAA